MSLWGLTFVTERLIVNREQSCLLLTYSHPPFCLVCAFFNTSVGPTAGPGQVLDLQQMTASISEMTGRSAAVPDIDETLETRQCDGVSQFHSEILSAMRSALQTLGDSWRSSLPEWKNCFSSKSDFGKFRRTFHFSWNFIQCFGFKCSKELFFVLGIFFMCFGTKKICTKCENNNLCQKKVG